MWLASSLPLIDRISDGMSSLEGLENRPPSYTRVIGGTLPGDAELSAPYRFVPSSSLNKYCFFSRGTIGWVACLPIWESVFLEKKVTLEDEISKYYSTDITPATCMF